MTKTLALALLLAAGQAAAAENGPQCPKTLSVAETATALPSGFTAYVDGNPPAAASAQPVALPLQDILFSEGPLTDQALLAPTETVAKSRRWKFDPAGNAKIWLTCAYQGTTIVISTPLPAAIRHCAVGLEKDGKTVTGLDCR